MAYAIVRAVVPPALFLTGWLFLAEPSRLVAFAGLGFVLVSVFLFAGAGGNWRIDSRGLLLSIYAGLVLALALFLDIKGIRAGGTDALSVLRYSVASSLTTAGALILLSSIKGVNPFAVLKNDVWLCYAGASLLLASYLFGMWAYAQGPVSLVAPLRESGILFGGVLAVLLLHERVTELQWTAMVFATIGVILVQIN